MRASWRLPIQKGMAWHTLLCTYNDQQRRMRYADKEHSGLSDAAPDHFAAEASTVTGKEGHRVFSRLPKLTRTVGVLTAVSQRNFKVGRRVFDFDTSFYIVHGRRTSQRLPYEVVATAEDIGSLTGKLLFVGRGFVEFIQVPGRRVPTIFPLNQFTSVTCSKEGEE